MMQQHNMLLAGGTVIDETGERRADVRVREGIITEISSDLSAGDDELVDIAGCIVAPDLSTCTPTFANRECRRPKRLRPAHELQHSADTPQWSPCRTPTPHKIVLRSSICLEAWPRGRAVRCAAIWFHHHRPCWRSTHPVRRSSGSRSAPVHRRWFGGARRRCHAPCP